MVDGFVDRLIIARLGLARGCSETWRIYGKIALARKGLHPRRDGRAAYGACLENRCGATHRGFESLSLR